MISLEQIQLLEQKVESAVAKILQLTEERDALHQRCVQLEEENKRLQSNILDFNQDQDRIEQGIIKALEKLNAVENSVLQAVAIQRQFEEPVEPVVQDFNTSPVVETESQQVCNNVAEEPYNPVPPQMEQPVYQPINDDLRLVPMFSEEVLKNDSHHEEAVSPVELYTQDLGLQPDNNSLFVENQDSHDSEQLDIF